MGMIYMDSKKDTNLSIDVYIFTFAKLQMYCCSDFLVRNDFLI